MFGLYKVVYRIDDVVLVRVFFFSSRRRHTRLQGDWSSDVCSSDLEQEKEQKGTFRVPIYSEDIDRLDATADAITARVLEAPHVLGLRKDGDRPTEEVALVVDRDRAQRLGISPQVVAAVVGYALRGQALPRYSQDGKEVPVRVRFQEDDRGTLAQLEDFAVPGPGGELVPLRAVTRSVFLPAPREIEREDRRTTRELVFELEEGKEKEARE